MKDAAIAPKDETVVSAPVVPYVEANPVSVLTDDSLRERFFAEIEAEIDKQEPDLTTDKGRKAIASFARQYVTTKTAIDAAGKKMNEEARARIDAVDAVRREVRERLDDMRDRARAPLTEWEEKEKERKEKIAAVLDLLSTAPVVLATDTSETIAARLAQVEAVPDDEVYAKGKDTALTALRSVHASIIKMEAEREELVRLRAAEEERKREEEARAAEAHREAEEAARKEREEQTARDREAAKAAQAKAEAEAKAAREEAEKALAEARRLAAEKEAADRAEAQRKAEEARLAAEEEARQKDRKHRSAVMKAAKEALMVNCGLDEGKAKDIVTAISKNLITNVTLNF